MMRSDGAARMNIVKLTLFSMVCAFLACIASASCYAGTPAREFWISLDNKQKGYTVYTMLQVNYYNCLYDKKSTCYEETSLQDPTINDIVSKIDSVYSDKRFYSAPLYAAFIAVLFMEKSRLEKYLELVCDTESILENYK